ncbi:MAG: GTPase [Planctomycetota bacterium]
MNDGRASLLTPVGRGAVAVVAAEGLAAAQAVQQCFAAANGRPLAEQPIGAIVFGHWQDRGQWSEEVVLVRTSEDRLEVQCHGGVAAPRRVMSDFRAAGCRPIEWLEWMSDAGEELLKREALEALASTRTQRAAAVAFDQYYGALGTAISQVRRQLATRQMKAAAERLKSLLAAGSWGLRATQSWRTLLAGRPNVGKSSLLNALLGYRRAIVYEQPGTTRDVLSAETAIDGWPVRLMDAAGIRATDDEVEAAGVALARRQLQRCELVVWVLDGSLLTPRQLAAPHRVAGRQMELLPELATSGDDHLIVINKLDAIASPSLIALDCIAVSATTGQGIPELIDAIGRRIAPDCPRSGSAAPINGRQMGFVDDALTALESGCSEAALRALDELIGSGAAQADR